MKAPMVRTSFESFSHGQVIEYTPVNSNGIPLVDASGGASASAPSSATRSSVTADGTVQNIAANSARKSLQMLNTSDTDIYIFYASSGTPTALDCDILLAPDDLWIEPARPAGVYTGAYRVISASPAGSGALRVVEF